MPAASCSSKGAPPPPNNADVVGTTKPSRSQFIEKLHALLENPYDIDNLRWVSHDSFEISASDAKARAALSPQWDFRSLSSFIRQLSYYNFKRLSDRRRSSERRASANGYIVFTHPSGYFVQGDNSRLDRIVRKLRARPTKDSAASGRRRVSTGSSGSLDNGDVSPPAQMHLPLPPVPTNHHFEAQQSTWQAPSFRPQFGSDRRPLLPSVGTLPTFTSSFGTGPASSNSYAAYAPPVSPTYPPESSGSRRTDVTTWRSYTPSTSSFTNTARRSSIPNFKLSSPLGIQRPEAAYANALEERPRLRKAMSTMCIQTVEQQQQQQQHVGGDGDYRSAYPTPTYAPAPYNSNSPWYPPHSNDHQSSSTSASGLPLPFSHPWASSSTSTPSTSASASSVSLPALVSSGNLSPQHQHQQLRRGSLVPSVSSVTEETTAVANNNGLPSPTASHSNPITPSDEYDNPLMHSGLDPRKLSVQQSHSPYGPPAAGATGHYQHVHQHYEQYPSSAGAPHGYGDTEHDGGHVYFAENRAPLWQPAGGY